MTKEIVKVIIFSVPLIIWFVLLIVKKDKKHEGKHISVFSIKFYKHMLLNGRDILYAIGASGIVNALYGHNYRDKFDIIHVLIALSFVIVPLVIIKKIKFWLTSKND